MFDLFRSRDTAVRYLLGGLLVLVAFSMLIYLIPGAGLPSTGSSGGEVVAEVGKEQVTSRDIQQLIQERLQSRQIPADMVQYLLPQLIDQRISDIAVAYQAKRMGYEVSDADLANAIRSMPNVGTLPPDQYSNYIAQLGMTVPEFEANVRKRMAILHLQDVVLQGIVVTPQEIQQEYNRRNEKIKLDYIAFDPAKIRSEVKPSDQELRSYFERLKGQFSIPETRSFEIVVADPQRVAESLQVPEQQIQAYYNQHKDQFRTPERVKVRHILLTTTGKSKEEVAKIRAKADDLLKQIKNGGDFGELAKKNSEDPGSKANGGDLGWVVRGQTVKNFEASAFSLKPNEISPIVTTEYGFHILQALEKQDAHLQTYDEMKPQIAAEMKKGMLNDRVQSLADQAHAEIAKAPKNAEQIASKLGLTFARADKVRPGDPMPIIGADKQANDTVFSLKKGDVSPTTQVGNRLAIFVMDDIHAPHPAEYADVQAQVLTRYQNEQSMRLAAERSKEAGDLLKANGGDLNAVAKKYGLEVKSSDWFNQQGAVEGLGSASYFADAFSKSPGYAIGTVNVGTQTVVAKLAGKQEADPAKLAGERDNILQQIKGKKAEERNQLFEDSVLTKLLAEHKVKINHDVINRIMARYRG